MTPTRRQKLEAALDLIRDVNGADAWGTLTKETREALIGLSAAFIDGQTNTITLAEVTAACDFDNGEHLLLRWAANARTALADADEEIPFVSAFTEIEAGGCDPAIIVPVNAATEEIPFTSGFAEMRDLPSDEESIGALVDLANREGEG